MCARASSQQSAIEPVAAVAAPTEGRRELHSRSPQPCLFCICTCSCTGDVIVCTLVGRCGDKGRCGLRVTRECPPARVRPGYWSRLRAVVCELSEGAVGDQVDRRIELASGRRTGGRAEQKEQGWEGAVRRWHCQEERGRRMWKRWEPGFGLGGRHWWHTGETLTRFGELDTMMSADVDYKYSSTKVLGNQTNKT